MKKKRKNLSKNEILFRMRCNEIAANNVEKFMAGDISLEELISKVYGLDKNNKQG